MRSEPSALKTAPKAVQPMVACLLACLLSPSAAHAESAASWVRTDSACPWSPAVAGLSGRIIEVDFERGQVFVEFTNVGPTPFTMPWCLFSADTPLPSLHADAHSPLMAGFSRVKANDIVTLTAWNGINAWVAIRYPQGLIATAILPSGEAQGPPDAQMSRITLLPGEHVLDWVAGVGLSGFQRSQFIITLHQPPGDAQSWSGDLSLGPCPWYLEPPAESRRRAVPDARPNHVPAFLSSAPDDAAPAEHAVTFYAALGEHADLLQALRYYRSEDVASWYLGRALMERSALCRIEELYAAAVQGDVEESCLKLTDYLRAGESEVDIEDALQALTSLAARCVFSDAVVDRILSAQAKPGVMVATATAAPRDLSMLVRTSGITVVMGDHHHETYLRRLRLQLKRQGEDALTAARMLARSGDASGEKLLLGDLERKIAIWQTGVAANTVDDSLLREPLQAMVDLHSHQALAMITPLLHKAWSRGQLVHAVGTLGDARSAAWLQDLSDHLPATDDAGIALSIYDATVRRKAIALALARLMPDWLERVGGLYHQDRLDSDTHLECLSILAAHPLPTTIPLLREMIRGDYSQAVADRAIDVLLAIPGQESAPALISLLDDDFSIRIFATTPALQVHSKEMIAAGLRSRFHISIGTDAMAWQRWWHRQGSLLEHR